MGEKNSSFIIISKALKYQINLTNDVKILCPEKLQNTAEINGLFFMKQTQYC